MLDPEEEYLCPVTAIARWIAVCGSQTTGPLFRHMSSGDRPSNDTRLASDTFLEWFRNLLVDIDVSPFLYGTHSFRRGGCQFLHIYLRWPIRKVADWGGWSTEYSWNTIVTYLINWTDNDVVERKYFLHPSMQPLLHCSVCGRTCSCNSY
ncbi:hypothetical protein C8J57DRAFT_1065685 [Mycena rebaudengoi]|nr:hypothetical protein C8J57DRAFT_1065685 [Mycena rebaudengoi]